jgi:putative heme-binding domain-containing protein
MELKKADLKNGRNLFHAAACATCHRFDGLGGDIGPDLSMVRTKFDTRYLLESIIEPSKNISDQYGSKIIFLENGEQVNGLVIPRETHYDIYPTTKSNKKVIPRKLAFKDVVKIEDSPISQMPPMLINTMNPNEVRDLIAYLLSSGIDNSK